MRAEWCRDLPDLRCLSQPGEAQAGVGIAHPEVPILVSVLDASVVWIFKRADANVVSVFGAGVRERAGVAGAADGSSGDEVRAAGSLFSRGGRMGPGPKVAGWTAPDELAEGAGAAGASVEPGARADLWGLSHELLLDDVSARVGQDRKSTRLNSSHGYISYAVFCL